MSGEERGSEDLRAAGARRGGVELPTGLAAAKGTGLLILLVLFGGFGSWAAFSELEAAVIAPGSVKVDSNRKKVQHLEGGIVRELRVGNGDRVERGDVLIRLDETRPRAQLQILRGRHASARAAVTRLQAELTGAESLSFAEDLFDGIEDDATVGQIVAGQTELFRTRRAALDAEVAMVRERVGQFEEEIVGRRAQIEARSAQIDLLDEELDALRTLREDGHVPKTRILALERERASLAGERGEHRAAIARARRLMSEAELEALRIGERFAQDVAERLRQRQDEVFDLAERISAAEFTVDRINVTAPVTGHVVGLQVHTEGGVVRGGETLMEIVPEDDALTIESRVRPVDIDEVEVGQSARVVFVGLPQRSTPNLVGTVRYASADAMKDEATRRSFYTVRVEVPEQEVSRLGEQPLQPGMPAEVMIRTGARTPLEYLVRPISDSLRRAWKES